MRSVQRFQAGECQQQIFVSDSACRQRHWPTDQPSPCVLSKESFSFYCYFFTFFFFELRFIDIIQFPFPSSFLSVLQKNQTPVCRSAHSDPNTPLLATHPTPFPYSIPSGSGFLDSPGPFLSFSPLLLVSFLLRSSHPLLYPCRRPLLILQDPVQPGSS